MWACDKFRHYIIIFPPTIVTDHEPNISLASGAHVEKRRIRWKFRLMEFHPIMKFKQGKLMHVADALSRLPADVVPDVLDDDLDSVVDPSASFVRHISSTAPSHCPPGRQRSLQTLAVRAFDNTCRDAS